MHDAASLLDPRVSGREVDGLRGGRGRGKEEGGVLGGATACAAGRGDGDRHGAIRRKEGERQSLPVNIQPGAVLVGQLKWAKKI